jgi:hypothetical protein
MKFTLSKKLILYISLIATGIILVLTLVIIPGIKYIINLHQDVKEAQNELDSRYERAKQLKRTIQEIETVKESSKKYSQAILPINQELNIITELENLADQNNIEQNLNINFVSTKKNSTSTEDNKENLTKNRPALPNYYQLSFLNNGSLANHLKYLVALETKLYYIILTDLNFEKRRNDLTTSTPITLRFNAIIYAE